MKRHTRSDSAYAVAFTAVVIGVTAAVQARAVSANTLASTPRRFAEGKLWLLLSNGTFVQNPIVVSLLSFAILSFATARLCGGRKLLTTALAGHVGSTILAYSLVAAEFSIYPTAGHHLANTNDYGVSAIQAAWIGAIAANLWHRPGQTRRAQAAVILACLAVTIIAYAFRHHLTLLDSDHLFAFAIGVTLATGAHIRPSQQARVASRAETAS